MVSNWACSGCVIGNGSLLIWIHYLFWILSCRKILLHVATNGGAPTSSSDVLDLEPAGQAVEHEEPLPHQGNLASKIFVFCCTHAIDFGFISGMGKVLIFVYYCLRV